MVSGSEAILETGFWSASSVLPGLEDVWAETHGEPEVRIAVVDGPVDASHPCLRGANLTAVPTLVPAVLSGGPAAEHGTHVASLIFGQHSSPMQGVAPWCRGLLLPIFESRDASSVASCSQLDLARVLLQAIQQRVQVVNISSGQFSPSGAAYPLLANAVSECARHGILIIAAAGNDGCACLHVPAALDTVLAVGAMDARGEPLPFSNWGVAYQRQGLLAPGRDIPGAQPGGGIVQRSGTSYATALVTGVAALLLSLQHKRGDRPNPRAVREALLGSAIDCRMQPVLDCRRLLAGRLNVRGAVFNVTQGVPTMSEPITVPSRAPESSAQPAGVGSSASLALPGSAQPVDAVGPSAAPATGCSCQGARAPRLVYALGQIGYDFISEARLDSFVQTIAGLAGASTSERVHAFDSRRLLAHLDAHPHEAASLEWTLSLHGHPIYAIRPVGPFAADAYKELRRFLGEQLNEQVERVSIPGVIAGQTTLLMGQVVPVIVPELRGMFSWTTAALVDAVVGPTPTRAAERTQQEQRRTGVRNFLQRVYHEVHNLGVLPQERALNFAATNASAIAQAYESAIRDEMDLESINVVRSSVCRPGSDCWDVEVYFFYPQRQVQTVRRVYRITVDVSDLVPVSVGPLRSWSTR
jgi:hypothetical protein